MRIISFAYTTPALLAGRKTVTRRDWDDDYARLFRAGDQVAAYDRSPRYGGKQVAVIELIRDPYREHYSEMPEEDYEGEGFAYLAEIGARPPRSCGFSDFTRRTFDEWHRTPGSAVVLRFRLVSLFPIPQGENPLTHKELSMQPDEQTTTEAVEAPPNPVESIEAPPAPAEEKPPEPAPLPEEPKDAPDPMDTKAHALEHAFVRARALDRAISEKDLEIADAQRHLKALKEGREQLVTELRHCIRDSGQGQLFALPLSGGEEVDAETGEISEPEKPEGPEAAEAELAEPPLKLEDLRFTRASVEKVFLELLDIHGARKVLWTVAADEARPEKLSMPYVKSIEETLQAENEDEEDEGAADEEE